LFWAIVIAVLIFVIYHFLGEKFFMGAVVLVDMLLLAIIAIFIYFVANIAIFESFFNLEVAGGLSLLFLIGQMYCASPFRNVMTNSAFQWLFWFGLAYVAFLFLKEFDKQLKKYFEKFKGKKMDAGTVIVIVGFFFFAILLIWEIVIVITPIILNLCVPPFI
ncbi:hypothetical protein KGQ74_02345, partial [Patescibacteria group bacterium]|nr:hypothetical protein [Patescibacteria group bacterium]